jgi:prephenate dehydrogenase
VVLATPVRSLGEAAAEIAKELDDGALVFDVGSVKGAAIASVEPKLRPGAYIACHPIAGTERVGPDAASPLLFEGKRCVICPTPRSDEAAVATVERLWTAMGAEPVRMTAELHDRVFGAGSHLPHVAAYSLAAALGQLAPDVIEGIRRLPTSSLRDTTRVAASSPAMWRDILLDNRTEVLPLIEALAGCLQELRAAVAAGDAARIEKLLVAGKAGRDRFIAG